jgi:hypothetical protein
MMMYNLMEYKLVYWPNYVLLSLRTLSLLQDELDYSETYVVKNEKHIWPVKICFTTNYTMYVPSALTPSCVCVCVYIYIYIYIFSFENVYV